MLHSTKCCVLFACSLFLINNIDAQAPPPKFLNEIVIPPLVSNPDSYELNVIETTHDFNPHDMADQLNGVTTFAFEDNNNPGTTTLLGPTLRWQYKNMLTPSVHNQLPDRTTCHWHGAHVPQVADGGPYQIIQPDAVWQPSFQVLDKSATMWYHPHAMGLTYEHVQMGLSGIIIVEDPIDNPSDSTDDILVQIHELIPTAYGENDFPLIFQTKKFKEVNGRMEIQAKSGFKKDYEFMVNGIIDPYMNVPADMIRLRMLNGDGKFSFNFSFEQSNGDLFAAHMIATDAGYMDKSYQLDELLMAPGERTEWLLDLRDLEGDTLYINNKVSNMPNGVIGNNKTTSGYADDRYLLKLIIGPSSGHTSSITDFPIALLPLETPPLSQVSRERTKKFLKGVFQNDGGSDIFSIDSALMDMMVINDTVMLDATEVWTIDNETSIAHPWHIHDIHFWVVEAIDSMGNTVVPEDYPELFKGPKDNVLVRPGWKVSYITTFSDFATDIHPTNSYMYHCHILPHEDNGMMGTFVVWHGLMSSTDQPDYSDGFITVAPNPVVDELYIKGVCKSESIVRIYTLDGKLLASHEVAPFSDKVRISTGDLSPSMYMLELQSDDVRVVKKIVVSR